MTKTSWRIVGDEVATCNCAWGCPCQFNALPTHGRCEAIVAVRIAQGHYGATRLDDVTFGLAYWWPGAVHDGNGISRLAIDSKASESQREAIRNISGGREGGTMFEIFASVTATVLDPLIVPIQFDSDYQGRVARVKIAGLGEFRTEPIRNPVTGEEHRARIQLPDGFEYKEAEMANCVEHRVTLGDKTFSNQNSYAQFCHVDWSNA